jgi:hypothetical protein
MHPSHYFLMKHKHLKIGIGSACALLAVVLVLRAMSGGDSSGVEKKSVSSDHASDHTRNSKAGYGKGVRESNSNPGDAFPQIESRSLDLPALPVDEKRLGESANDILVSSVSLGPRSDDDILAKGGVLPVMAKSAPKVGNPAAERRSIKSEDWKGAANLLVNALRAGDRFELNQDELMDFLRGKDLRGWPESYRNWIGDELMTALRQDMPDKAFESLKAIEADSTAPAAMRDYSVQHISHLVTGGVIGKEGANYIWRTLEENDPQTLGTALISLHRLSEQVPEMVSSKDVQAAAERLKESPDERTRITAESILKN